MTPPHVTPLRNPVGTHVKVGPGLARGTLKGARELGLEALQVFTGNPRGWALSEGDPREDSAFREGCAEDGIRVVVHTGSYVAQSHEGAAADGLRTAALRRVRDGLLPILDTIADDTMPWLLLDEEGGTTATVDRVVEIAGPGRLRLVHANDSKDPRGSMRDRHERLGEGHIGTGAIAELLRHPATEGVPFILETPGSRDPGSDQIALVKTMRL